MSIEIEVYVDTITVLLNGKVIYEGTSLIVAMEYAKKEVLARYPYYKY